MRDASPCDACHHTMMSVIDKVFTNYKNPGALYDKSDWTLQDIGPRLRSWQGQCQRPSCGICESMLRVHHVRGLSCDGRQQYGATSPIPTTSTRRDCSMAGMKFCTSAVIGGSVMPLKWQHPRLSNGYISALLVQVARLLRTACGITRSLLIRPDAITVLRSGCTQT